MLGWANVFRYAWSDFWVTSVVVHMKNNWAILIREKIIKISLITKLTEFSNIELLNAN